MGLASIDEFIPEWGHGSWDLSGGNMDLKASL
jgi:hypothetical protein